MPISLTYTVVKVALKIVYKWNEAKGFNDPFTKVFLKLLRIEQWK